MLFLVGACLKTSTDTTLHTPTQINSLKDTLKYLHEIINENHPCNSHLILYEDHVEIKKPGHWAYMITYIRKIRHRKSDAS